MQKKQQLKKLVMMFGKGNLLEAMFIFLGGYQNTLSHDRSSLEYIDHRNFFYLYEFINKTKTQPLDQYFKLKLSLQGLCLIYEKAYRALNCSDNPDISAQAVADGIYSLASSNQELIKVIKIVEKEKNTPIKFLNMIANPKGEPLFNNLDDFETKVLKNIRELINKIKLINSSYGITSSKTSKYLDETDETKEKKRKQFYEMAIPLYNALIELYCQISNININKNIILALIIFTKEEKQYLPDDTPGETLTMLDAIGHDNSHNQIINFANFIQLIEISGENYIFDNEKVDEKLNNTKIVYAGNNFIPAGISKDSLNYLINSDSEDLAKNFEDKVLKSTNVEFNKRKIALYTIGTAFIILLSSSMLGKFFHNKYNIAALAISGTVIPILSVFTFCYTKTQQQKPLSKLNHNKVNSHENKELAFKS